MLTINLMLALYSSSQPVIRYTSGIHIYMSGFLSSALHENNGFSWILFPHFMELIAMFMR